MPEIRRRSRFLGACGALAVLGAVAIVPAVSAQTDEPTVSDPAEWSESSFTDPFSHGSATVTTSSFPISGLFVKQRDVGEQIIRVTVDFSEADESEGPSTSAPSTTAPSTSEPDADDPTGAGVQCVPDDPRSFVGDGTVDEETTSYPFSVTSEVSTWPCNGRYLVTAAAQSNQEANPFLLTGVLTVAVPPLPVTEAGVTVDDDANTVEVTWEPLAEEDLAVDALGYRVERAGPQTDGGSFGPFRAVGADVGLDDPSVLVDTLEAGGTYRYRVRALRAGADGPVLSPLAGTATVDATVTGEPASTTTTTASTAASTRPSGPRLGGTGGSASIPRRPQPNQLTTPTTVDTGFGETLDYGDREQAFGDSPELAGEEGQSIIRTDDEGSVGLLAPAAGALVLIGWAGHVAYLNRLAKQF